MTGACVVGAAVAGACVLTVGLGVAGTGAGVSAVTINRIGHMSRSTLHDRLLSGAQQVEGDLADMQTGPPRVHEDTSEARGPHVWAVLLQVLWWLAE